ASCQLDSDCSKYPGYVCSNNPRQWAKYRTCIFGCHSDDNCNTERNSKCLKTFYPHWFCNCTSDVDCHSFGHCYNDSGDGDIGDVSAGGDYGET
ncbi:1158_t:CDS:2, partial [Rhizophagus irregularis]